VKDLIVRILPAGRRHGGRWHRYNMTVRTRHHHGWGQTRGRNTGRRDGRRGHAGKRHTRRRHRVWWHHGRRIRSVNMRRREPYNKAKLLSTITLYVKVMYQYQLSIWDRSVIKVDKLIYCNPDLTTEVIFH